MERTESILVPLELSNGSCAALALAKNLALECNAKLTLLHVVHLNIAGEERGIPRARLINELCRNAELQLKELASDLCDSVTAEVLVREGCPADTIVQEARRLKVDTIVMHAHDHRGWSNWLHRNTVAQVVRKASCGTLLVSTPKPDAALNPRFMGRTTINEPSERLAHLENRSPFRSIVRLLFS